MYQIFIFGNEEDVRVVYATDLNAAYEVARAINGKRSRGGRKAIVYPQTFSENPMPGFEKEHAELMEFRGE